MAVVQALQGRAYADIVTSQLNAQAIRTQARHTRYTLVQLIRVDSIRLGLYATIFLGRDFTDATNRVLATFNDIREPVFFTVITYISEN
ncbi:hypothetical protein D3C71_1768740 [compost metagenome]